MRGLIRRLRRGDEQVLLYVVACRLGWLDGAMRWFTHLGGAAWTITLAGALVVSPLVAWSTAGQRAAFALIASHLGVQMLKRSVSRPRPRLAIGSQSLAEAPDRFSFPSGHAAASLSLALGVATALPPAAAPLILGMGLLVGVSRCYLGVHYPGDVAAGWILAFAAFLAGAHI